MDTPPLPKRKSPRLQGYDYRLAGEYFVTICCYQRQHHFGEIVNANMRLSWLGELAAALWLTIPDHHLQVELDLFVVMPNHVHGIVILADTPQGAVRPDEARLVPTTKSPLGAPARSLGAVIGGFKSAVTRAANHALGAIAPIIWQGRYHDHVIRNERELNCIREYILTNPARWESDTFHPSHKL